MNQLRSKTIMHSALVLLITFIIFITVFASSCGNLSEESKEIIETFSSFESKGGIYCSYDNNVFLPDKTIQVDDLEYNGKKCRIAACYDKVFYAYYYEKTNKTYLTLYLLSITYDNLEITLFDTIEEINSKTGIGVRFCIDNKMYFAIDKKYFVYDLETKSYNFVSAVLDGKYRYAQDFSNYRYEILGNKNPFNRKQYGIEIKDKTTEETRTVTMENLSSFPEGEYILSLDSSLTKTFFVKALEKDGYMYILGMITLDKIANMKSQCVALKYDFKNDNLSYYSSLYYDWDEVPNFFVS